MIKFIFAAVLCLHGAAFAKTVDTQSWARLIERVQAKGQRQVSDMFTTQFLEHNQPSDKTKAHRAIYFSLFNVNTAHGIYPRSTAVTDETWTINDQGNWEIDQWLFEANLHGELRRVGHYAIEELPDHSIIKWKALLFTSAMTPALNDHFVDELAPWLN